MDDTRRELRRLTKRNYEIFETHLAKGTRPSILEATLKNQGAFNSYDIRSAVILYSNLFSEKYPQSTQSPVFVSRNSPRPTTPRPIPCTSPRPSPVTSEAAAHDPEQPHAQSPQNQTPSPLNPEAPEFIPLQITISAQQSQYPESHEGDDSNPLELEPEPLTNHPFVGSQPSNTGAFSQSSLTITPEQDITTEPSGQSATITQSSGDMALIPTLSRIEKCLTALPAMESRLSSLSTEVTRLSDQMSKILETNQQLVATFTTLTETLKPYKPVPTVIPRTTTVQAPRDPEPQPPPPTSTFGKIIKLN